MKYQKPIAVAFMWMAALFFNVILIVTIGMDKSWWLLCAVQVPVVILCSIIHQLNYPSKS